MKNKSQNTGNLFPIRGINTMKEVRVLLYKLQYCVFFYFYQNQHTQPPAVSKLKNWDYCMLKTKTSLTDGGTKYIAKKIIVKPTEGGCNKSTINN